MATQATPKDLSANDSQHVKSIPHPLSQLSVEETHIARDVILKAQERSVVQFRSIYLEEPAKPELLEFLDAEHKGTLDQNTPRPARLARVQYDAIRHDKIQAFHQSIVNIHTREAISHTVLGKEFQPSLLRSEFGSVQEVCNSKEFKDALAQFDIPDGFVVTIDPWPYGGPDPGEVIPRYIQGLCFARDNRTGASDSNHYAYPIPLIPVIDTSTSKIVRIDRLATGGEGDDWTHATHAKGIIDHCHNSEYFPESIGGGLRGDIKPLNITQPEGPSFTVSSDNLVEWQKWRFRVGFTPREGAVIHDVWYNGRSILHRLSFSEMTVPYADPRPPFHRKQAFDFGDGGAGRSANNLNLGCDCLGVIRYFDSVMTDASGTASLSKNVVCLHEQDNGIGWKHTNFRTDRAVVTRSRELVVQFVITLANYDYVFAYKFDQAAGITVETRATGIVSGVNIDPGKTSRWGNVVSPGVLAQHHQHIFCLRIDPAIDGNKNTVCVEDSLTLPFSQHTNPWGNGYEVRTTEIDKSQWLDACPSSNRNIKIVNSSKINPISRKPVGYKFMPPATQLLMAHPDSIVAKRAQFAQHHVWVTKYKEGELWAAGEFTNQSQAEIGGLADAIKRKDDIVDEDVVVWSVFGLSHNPRVEDWPVMPVEIQQLHLKPADFFERNPALDVPSTRNMESKMVETGDCCSGEIQSDPATHWQGVAGLDISSDKGV
ncbi:MAG: hypothetical protein M1829_000029 [Trizodia sp. TS-e1964]|nr:MAG: hypothetical protein M1829_000029 [Trizodia sp. TS-e1964]